MAMAQSIASRVYGQSLSNDLRDLERLQYANKVKSIQEIDEGVWRNLHVVGSSFPNASIPWIRSLELDWG